MKILDNIKSAITGKENDIPINSDPEARLLSEIASNQQSAETKRLDIETTWEDEEKCFVGDQWDLSFARRSSDSKQVRPNSIDNFVFPAITNMLNTLTSTTPEATIEGREEDGGDDEIAKKLTDNVMFIMEKNKFPDVWKEMVLQGIKHGPFIGYVPWDNDWVGGTGPNRWVGEVRIIAQKKEEIYFDPAIRDLRRRLQECSFIHRKLRKKLSYFKQKWDKGEQVNADDNGTDDEGVDHNQAWLYEAWHKGKPKFIPDEWKKKFTQKAEEAMNPVDGSKPDYYKAEQYKLMAAGKMDGVHVSYASQNVFLEYVPYVYDNGMYPFVYKTLYQDYKSPYGFGEIRNVMVPQVMHNKADEIEIEAMSVEGLGGAYYSKGALDTKQLSFIQQNTGKGGMWAEVNNASQIKERTGAKVPPSIASYKEHKQRMVETISKNTPIQQGIAPGSNVPMGTIKELGARTDIGTKGRVEILEDFLKELVEMILSRIKQFYTEERSYRIRDGNTPVFGSKVKNMPKMGRFSNREMTKKWEREEIIAEDGTPLIKEEEYIPEFDAKVKIVDDRPTDRGYYLQIADKLMQIGLLDPEDYLYVVEEGKLPPKELILQKYKQRQAEAAQAKMMQTQQSPQQQQGGVHPADELFNALTPEQQQQFMSMTPEQQTEIFAKMMGGT